MKIDSIYEKHRKEVYYFLFSLSGNGDVAQELTSEVFLSAIIGLPSFRGDCNIQTWLFSIAKHKWFEFVRKEKRNCGLKERLCQYIEGSDYFDQTPSTQTAQKLLELLGEEPERTRNIINMRVEGYSFAEIAQQIGISQSSARVIDFRAKKKLQQKLLEEGYSYE